MAKPWQGTSASHRLLTSKAFIVCTSWQLGLEKQSGWIMGFKSYFFSLPSNKQHQHVCSSQISNGCLKWQEFLLREKLHRWNESAKPRLRSGLSRPHPSSSWRVGPSEVFGAWHRKNNMDALFFLFCLKDSLPPIHSGTDSGQEPPTALSFCETRRVLIGKGTHHCGSPQQRLIASGVGPQTWHLCPRAQLNWQTACWLALSLHLFLILCDWFSVYFGWHRLFYWPLHVILQAVAASTDMFCLRVFWVCRTKLKVLAMMLCFGPSVWNSLWCSGITLALTCGEAGCKGQAQSNHQVVSH